MAISMASAVAACAKVTGYPAESFRVEAGYSRPILSLHGTPYTVRDGDHVLDEAEMREGWHDMGASNGIRVYRQVPFV